MSTFPSGISRVPNLLLSRLSGGSITRTNLAIARLQEQLSTGLAINRPSDDSVKAAAISLINERLERGTQITRNLQHADSALTELDTALSDATDHLNQAREIGLAELNFSSDPEERRGQAIIVQSLIDGLFGIANRKGVAGHVLGGQTPGTTPIEALGGGYRYLAGADGLITDLGDGLAIPLTLGSSVLGGTSSRVVGNVDLDPDLTGETRISDLRGGRGLGVQLGKVSFTFGQDETRQVDLSGADTVQDVLDALASAIGAYEQDLGVDVLGAGGVSIDGKQIVIDVLGDPITGDEVDLVFGDVGGGTTAMDLGLNDDQQSMGFNRSNSEGLGLDPRLTLTTPIDALSGLDNDLGEIRVRAGGTSQVLDLSTAQSVQDLRHQIEQTGLGLRVQIDQQQDRLVVVNEVAGTRGQAMSIEEVDGNNATASALGIRTLDLNTPLSVFNDGRGVQVLSGGVDPITGDPDPAFDVDFDITLGNGTEIAVNLAPGDLASVGTLLDSINAQADQQLSDAGLSPTLFEATLNEDGPNGIAFTQDTGDASITGGITVTARNNSTAAWQLGLLDSEYQPATGTLLGEDRASIRVDSAFTHLLDLRESLENDDTFGIQIATQNMETDLSRVTESRAKVGGYGQQVQIAQTHQEDRTVLDETMRSQLQDLDFVAAASRFSLLQTQLQAGLQSAAALNRLSLLDFLG